MDSKKCVSCGRSIPKNRTICPRCEKEIKYGSILQSQDATAEEVEEVYEWLFVGTEDNETK